MRRRPDASLAAALVALAALAGDAAAQEAARGRFLDAGNAPLDPARDALAVTLRIPNDASLPRGAAYDGTSGDARDVRIEIVDASTDAREIEASLESLDALGTQRHVQEHVTLRRDRADAPFRSAFLRLVGGELDARAPDVGDRLLEVGLRDRVRVVYRGQALAELRVARPGVEDGAQAARRVRVRIRIVRNAPGGAPPIGGDDAGALALAREQIAIANEVWAQCAIGLGDPTEADVAIVDPPITSMIAVGDVDGLPAAGGGRVRLRAGGRAIASVVTRAGARPVETAHAIASALRRMGLVARVFENERAESGAGRSADVVVRARDGRSVAVTSDDGAPLSTDARQRVVLGAVELGDGLSEFDNMTALTGTLEERALVRALADDDERTIDVLVISEFAGRTRDGEAFVEGASAGFPGSIADVVLLSREGIARGRTALTFPHELGHVLLDHPLHPDHMGPDRPWLLMDSNTSDGSILGPRRLTDEECARARERSGVGASPPLLERWVD